MYAKENTHRCVIRPSNERKRNICILLSSSHLFKCIAHTHSHTHARRKKEHSSVNESLNQRKCTYRTQQSVQCSHCSVHLCSLNTHSAQQHVHGQKKASTFYVLKRNEVVIFLFLSLSLLPMIRAFTNIIIGRIFVVCVRVCTVYMGVTKTHTLISFITLILPASYLPLSSQLLFPFFVWLIVNGI